MSYKYLIDFIVLAIIYNCIFFNKWKSKGVGFLTVRSLMYVYVSLVLYVTLMPIVTSIPHIFNHSYQSMNMMPFSDYLSGRGDTERQIILNIIMMMPFGFLLPIIKRVKLWTCIIYTFLFSLGIELLQPFFMRSADITDLITNTVGGIIGYILYCLFKPLIGLILKNLNYNKLY